METARTKRILVTLCVVGLSLLAFAPASGAAIKKIRSTVVLSEAEVIDEGQVVNVRGSIKSPHRRCRGGRTVKLSHAGIDLGQVTTDGAGKFTIPVGFAEYQYQDYPLVAGAYTATVKKKRFGKRKRARLCKTDSAVLTVTDAITTGTISFDGGASTFSGDFDSTEPDCINGRLWALLYSTDSFQNYTVVSGQNPSGEFLPPDGSWTYQETPMPAGEYLAFTPYQGLPPGLAGNGDMAVTQCTAFDTGPQPVG